MGLQLSPYCYDLKRQNEYNGLEEGGYEQMDMGGAGIDCGIGWLQ